MRGAFLVTGLISLGAHALVAAVLLVPRARPGPHADPPPQVAGETFELPAPDTLAAPPAVAGAEPPPTAAEPEAEGDAPARPTRPVPVRSAARAPRRPAEPTDGDGASAGAAPALYGAVGERSAADLATAFTRGFPQAASADPIWRTAPLGSAGEAEVVLTLDEAGHIEGSEVLGAPSPALTSAMRRTLALIGARPFVAKGKVTRLRVVATITTDAVHDGLHGDVFAIGGSYAGGEGSAFFALAIGRRIDVRVSGR